MSRKRNYIIFFTFYLHFPAFVIRVLLAYEVFLIKRKFLKCIIKKYYRYKQQDLIFIAFFVLITFDFLILSIIKITFFVNLKIHIRIKKKKKIPCILPSRKKNAINSLSFIYSCLCCLEMEEGKLTLPYHEEKYQKLEFKYQLLENTRNSTGKY